jgi:hypothetical protein
MRLRLNPGSTCRLLNFLTMLIKARQKMHGLTLHATMARNGVG